MQRRLNSGDPATTIGLSIRLNLSATKHVLAVFACRPVLAFCLGHQVLAQGLGGLVQPRTAPGRHYALQESELLLLPSQAAGAIVDAVATVQRQRGNGTGGGCHGETEGGRGGGDGEKGVGSSSLQPQLTLRLLYHHNDEVGFFAHSIR